MCVILHIYEYKQRMKSAQIKHNLLNNVLFMRYFTVFTFPLYIQYGKNKSENLYSTN